MDNLRAWALNDRRVSVRTTAIGDLLEGILFTKLEKRPGFTYSQHVVNLPAVFTRFVGVDGDETEYYNKIYELHHRWSRHHDLYLAVKDGFDERIDPQVREKLQSAWRPIEREQSLPPRQVREVIGASGAMTRLPDPRHNEAALATMERILEWYGEGSGGGLRAEEAKNIAFSCVNWFNPICEKILTAFDYTAVNPKVLYYGPISTRETYFLAFLHFLGADVVVINTQEDTHFADLDPEGKLCAQVRYNRLLVLKPFPTEGGPSGVATDARQASEELREILHSDDGLFYRPWQLIDYEVESSPLRTTLEEVFILAPEKALERSGWAVADGLVQIPNIFAKIHGVHKDRKRYFREVNALRKLPKTHFVEKLPMVQEPSSLEKAAYCAALTPDKKTLDPEKLRVGATWPYASLPSHLQGRIASHTAKLCNLEGLKRIPSDPEEIQKLRVFTALMKIPVEVRRVLQQFDYPQEIPKLVIYTNGGNGVMSFEDAVIIRLVTSLGLDVVVLNPAAHSDIENFIESNAFDNHRLEELAFNLQLKGPSLLDRFF